MHDDEAVAVEFRAMMRSILRHEKVGEDTFNQVFALVQRWSNGHLTDAELKVALRRLHGEPVNPDDPRDVADEFASMRYGSYGETRVLPRERARNQAIARFAANARRLRSGEITREEFERILGDDIGGVRWV